MVDGLLYNSRNIADMYPSIEHYREFDSWFTAKPGKSRYPTVTAALTAVLEKRIEQAKDLFYKIPEDVRLRYVPSAKSRADRWHHDDLMKPLKFAQIFASQIRYNEQKKTEPYADTLDKMSNIAFETDDVLKKMFNTSSDKILRKLSEYFDYDPEEVYNQYGLDDYVHPEEEYEDYPGYTKASKTIAPVLKSTMGSKVEIFRERHDKTKKLDRWYIEPDGSLSPNEREDACVEIVGPPEAPNRALDSLKKFFGMAQQMKFYTNESTGLHINVSIPEDVDVLKLAVFTGDQYVLQQYGRLENNYSRSVTRDIGKQDNQRQLARALPQTQSGRGKNVFGNKKISSELKLQFIQKIAKDISNSHVASISSENKKYISFRHTGGDYLTDYQGIVNVVGRFVRAMVIASDPAAYRNEYLAAVAKLAAPAVSAQSPSAEKDIARIQQEGLSIITVYLLKDGRTNFKTLLSRAGYQASPNIIIEPIETNSEESYNVMGANARNENMKSRLADAFIGKFAKVIIRPTNFTASEYYSQRVSRALVGYVGDGYVLEILDKLPPTDPYVQQVILQMRRERFKK
jgi:hypothetical protein